MSDKQRVGPRAKTGDLAERLSVMESRPTTDRSLTDRRGVIDRLAPNQEHERGSLLSERKGRKPTA
jgi:hypothetical protein